MKVLTIGWQRLVKEDRTCDRCAATGDEVKQAVEVLRDVLRPLGIEPHLEIGEIDEAAFRDDAAASNRIWIAGKALEEWIGAEVGSSRCCSVCGDSECRTVKLSATSFEVIPQRLILKASLLAASDMLNDGHESTTACSCN
jgi:hypothetical protein